MININLVPEVKKEQAKVKKINLSMTSLAFVIGASLLAVILLLGSILGYRNTKISSVNKNIEKVESELVVYKELEESVITLENGLRDIKEIVDGGRDWTAFYNDIEKATPTDIRFVSFKVTGNSVSADVEGNDIKSIDRFLKSFSNYKDSDGANLYKSVLVDGYSAKDDGSVFFQANFETVGATK